MKPRTVVITGASAGVGRATAIAFARRGARIGLLARGRAGLEGALRDVDREGGKARTFQTDVANADQVEAAAIGVEEAFGPIDVWVNNAMASVFSPVSKMTPQDYERVTAVTYLGSVHGMLTALRHMRPRGKGVIVQVGSALAYRGIPLQSAYCAAKHAVQGFCDSLRAELIYERCPVHVTSVHLPGVNTPQFDWVKSRLRGRGQPVPPIFQPEIAADAIVWASEHRRREIYVGWPTFKAIVGNKVAPAYLDRYLARHTYQGQQAAEPEDPDRPHNLFEPVDDNQDFGAHGRFDERARTASWQLWVTKHRRQLAVAAAIIGVSGSLAALARRA